MVKTITEFRKRSVQKTGNGLYISLPCEIHSSWNISKGLKLKLGLTEEGDLIIENPRREVQNES